MASDLESRKASPDALVRRRLADVCRRLRRSEALGSLLLLALLFCGYALGMATFDVLAAERPEADIVHWLGFVLFLLATVILLGRLVVHAYRRVNPYYAARLLEGTVPGAHNSLINWLDLHDQKNVPSAFRKNLGAYAARHAKQSDPEAVIERRGHWILFALWLATVLGLLFLLARGPHEFVSLMRRAFLPFQGVQVASRTDITLLRPETGNVIVSPGQALPLLVHVAGRVADVNEPGAPALLYRYQPSDDFIPLPLQPDDLGNWGQRLSGDQIRTGLWYKIKAGAAETPEYQVQVRAQPQAQRIDVTYHYRRYLALPKKTISFPNQEDVFPRLDGHRGTEVEMIVRANRPLANGGIELVTGSTKKEVPGQMGGDPCAFRCRWVLERSGHFRILFHSAEREPNTDRTPYAMNVAEDGVPRVVLTRPGEDVALPGNGTLALAGKAEDDLGIKALMLRVQVVLGETKTPLQPRPYSEGKPLQFDDGTYPDLIEYEDFVPLNQMRTLQGQPFPLTPGMVLEYWLEALDNSDYPNKAGNLGKSATFKVNIQPDADPKQQQAERKQTEARQKQHAKQQAEKRTKEHQEKQKNQAGAPPKEGADEQNSPALDQLRKKKQETENKLQKALDEQKKRDDQHGQGKGENDQPKSDSKKGDQGAGGGAQPQQKDNASPEQAGQKKDGGQAGKSNSPGESKNAGQPQAGKDSGKQPPETKNGAPQGAKNNPDKGTGKQAASPPGGGEAKDEGKNGAGKEKQPGTAKSEGSQKEQAGKQASQEKGPGADAPSSQTKKDPADKKDPAQGGTPDGGNAGKPPGKDEGAGEARPAPGEPAPGQAKGADPKAQGKEPGAAADAKPPPQAKRGSTTAPGPTAAKEAAKPTPEAKESGTAKGDDPLANGQMKQPTWDDIARLKQHMQKKEGLGEAAKELADIGKRAEDPKMRDAARESLGQAGRDPTTGEPTNAEVGTPQAGRPANEKGDPKTMAKGGASKSAQPSEAPPKEPGAGGQSQPGGSLTGEEGKPGQANAEFARQGGSLQLEDLKKRVTPEILKKAGLTDADWQRYLKQAQTYDQLLHKQTGRRSAAKTNEVRGSGGSFAGTAPGRVNGVPAADAAPLDAGQAQPPPELREAQRRFSSRPPK
jgi:collagen type III alpha